ncbi:MAG: hypothetical protein KDA59_16015, partial [Planctomycetales bacterium]|nr:hypothetical protein [Planctomycetales bacterium]
SAPASSPATDPSALPNESEIPAMIPEPDLGAPLSEAMTPPAVPDVPDAFLHNPLVAPGGFESPLPGFPGVPDMPEIPPTPDALPPLPDHMVPPVGPLMGDVTIPTDFPDMPDDRMPPAPPMN